MSRLVAPPPTALMRVRTQRWRRHTLRSALLALPILVAAACGGGASGSGKSWPGVDIADTAGATLSSRAIVTPGRPAVISVWAVWCRPCREELPRLEELAASDTRVDVAAVNLGDSAQAVNDYIESLGLKLRVLIDSDGLLTEALGISSVPATIFVDSSGKVAEVHLGELSADDLKKSAARLLSA